MVKKVEDFKKKLPDPDGKERAKVTKFIATNKLRQEYAPPLGKYVDCIKPDPSHNVNNGWQQWFAICLTVAMQYSNDNQLKSATTLSDLPNSRPIIQFLNCVKDTMKCGRLFKSFSRWSTEKRKKERYSILLPIYRLGVKKIFMVLWASNLCTLKHHLSFNVNKS